MSKYSPQWAPHVSGEWTLAIDPETQQIEPFYVKLRCTMCGDESKVSCNSGAPHSHVQNYGRAHFHGDPMRPKKSDAT